MTDVSHDDLAFRASIRRELRSIRRDMLPPVWDDDASFRGDLGLDSLDLVEMVARLEQVTGVFVPDEDVGKLTSVAATADYVRERRREPAAAHRRHRPRRAYAARRIVGRDVAACAARRYRAARLGRPRRRR